MKKSAIPFLAGILSPLMALAQGDLTPPAGAPFSGMRTLTQIEPRTPIPGSPAVPAAGPHFIISSPGSYVLTGNITVTSGNAINIISDDVTLDLNGFTISSTSNSVSGTAIDILSSKGGITIHQGRIRGGTTLSGTTFTPKGFQTGINGVSASGPAGPIVIRHVTVIGMGGDGIVLGNNTFNSDQSILSVSDCSVQTIANYGIRAGVVSNCNAINTGTTAIRASLVKDSTAYCVGTVGTMDGIHAVNAQNCNATANNGAAIRADIVSNCSAISTNGAGINRAGTRGVVSNSIGSSFNGLGISSNNITNSIGSSSATYGILADNVTGCDGTSSQNSGISAITVDHSTGRSTNSAAISSQIASYCFVEPMNSGIAIIANRIAVASTTNGIGTVGAPVDKKFLGTP